MTHVQRTVDFVNLYRQILTNTSRSNTNIGAIVGGVVAGVVLVLGVVLLWYFKYRNRENSPRSKPPILTSELNYPGSAPYHDPWTVAVQGAFPSPFYGPSDTVGQVAYNPVQTGRTQVPQQAVTGYKAIYDPAGSGPNPSGTPHAPSDTLTSSTTPPYSSANANFNGTSSSPDAQREFRVNDKSSHGWSRYAVQNPTTPGPLPNSFYSNAVADGEPVEAGLMSKRMSTKSALPFDSPGGVRRDEGAPPLPGQ